MAHARPSPPLIPSTAWWVRPRRCGASSRQQTKGLGLRWAMSLGRLWQQQGQRTAAYRLLVLIYSWFTEGFDTADLQAAKALLDALA